MTDEFIFLAQILGQSVQMHQSLTKLATEQKLSRVAVDDFRRYKAMQKWYLDVGDMLA